MSCLQALDHLKIDHPSIEEIISKPTALKASGFDIYLCWLPGHVGIRGNERPDRAAKTALRTDMQPCLIPPSDFKPIIRKHITAMWQATWDESPLNKLHEIAPIVNEPHTHHLSTRRDQSVFNRCPIGHSRLTHEFLLKGEPPPECIPCNCPLTIKHLLIQCVDFNDVRQRFYQVPSLQDLFKTVKPEVMLEFLKAAALYRLLWVLKVLRILALYKISVKYCKKTGNSLFCHWKFLLDLGNKCFQWIKNESKPAMIMACGMCDDIMCDDLSIVRDFPNCKSWPPHIPVRTRRGEAEVDPGATSAV